VCGKSRGTCTSRKVDDGRKDRTIDAGQWEGEAEEKEFSSPNIFRSAVERTTRANWKERAACLPPAGPTGCMLKDGRSSNETGWGGRTGERERGTPAGCTMREISSGPSGVPSRPRGRLLGRGGFPAEGFRLAGRRRRRGRGGKRVVGKRERGWQIICPPSSALRLPFRLSLLSSNPVPICPPTLSSLFLPSLRSPVPRRFSRRCAREREREREAEAGDKSAPLTRISTRWPTSILVIPVTRVGACVK